MVATINNGGGFYRWELYLHEARLHGAHVERPCINTSQGKTIIRGNTIWLGFAILKDLEYRVIEKILNARYTDGPFKNLNDCVERTGISLEQVEILIRIGALRFTQKTKKALFWEAQFLLGNVKPKPQLPQLFKVDPKQYTLPALIDERFEDAFDEMELLGFPLCNPFELTRKMIPPHIQQADLIDHINKVVLTFGYLISIKNTSTIKKERMQFGTFIDQSGAFLDTVHFPPVAAKYPFNGRGIYRIVGKVTEEFDFLTIEVIHMAKEPYIDDPRYVSRQDELKEKFKETL